MKNLGFSFRKVLLTVTVSLGFIAPAQAAVYVGSWDPKYSSDAMVNGIGWEGTVNFTVLGTCAGTTGTFAASSCGGAEVNSASVTIYTWPNRAASTSFSFSSFAAIDTLTLEAGKVVGFTGGLSNFVYDITLDPGLTKATDFRVLWDATGPRMTYYIELGADGNKGPTYKEGINTLSTVGGDYAMTYTITAVPEASSLAMMIAGLGLVGFIGRNRKKRSDTVTL